jgi:Pin2-interacting protein X1
MLKKMGWSEDKGLGKNEDGATSAVKLDKRDTSLGLGMEADSAGNLAWNSTSSSFTDILKMLNSTYSEEAKKKEKAAKKKGGTRVTVGVK